MIRLYLTPVPLSPVTVYREISCAYHVFLPPRCPAPPQAQDRGAMDYGLKAPKSLTEINNYFFRLCSRVFQSQRWDISTVAHCLSCFGAVIEPRTLSTLITSSTTELDPWFSLLPWGDNNTSFYWYATVSLSSKRDIDCFEGWAIVNKMNRFGCRQAFGSFGYHIKCGQTWLQEGTVEGKVLL